MRWTTRSCQLDALWLQVNFFVNYCFMRSHSLKPTHCQSAGRQATNTHTLNSWERHFDQSLRLTAAMLDHHVQMSVFIACEQSWVYRRKYCFLSKIRWCTVINFIWSLACKRITMNTVPDSTVHIESKKSSPLSARRDRTDTDSHPEMCTFKCNQEPDLLFGYTSGKQCVAKAVTAIVHYYILNRAHMLVRINGNGMNDIIIVN